MRCPSVIAASLLFVTVRCTLWRRAGTLRGATSDELQQIRENDVAGKNPIRKVVGLLQNMAQRIEAEGEREAELYEKFICYCTHGKSNLQKSISDNDAKVPSVQSDIEEAESTVAKLKEDLKQHAISRAAAEKAMKEATALRDKEHKAFVAESTEKEQYIASLEKAIPAITTGMAGTRLLQTFSVAAASIRRAATADQQLTEDDRDSVIAFLSMEQGSHSRYVPSSLEVLTILKSMKEDYTKDVAGIKATEDEAVKLYKDLMSAKTKEVRTLTNSIEKKTERVGEISIEIVNLKHELTESEATLVEDTEFLNNLDTDCEDKKSEWEQRQKMRAEEQKAIYETIKILNSDDSLEMFKKTLPGDGSLLQVKGKQSAAVQSAASFLKKLRAGQRIANDRPEIRFLETALMGGKVDFSKVFKLIDDMLTLLKQEQLDDDSKAEYCRRVIDNVEDKAKELTRSLKDVQTSLDQRTETLATLADEIKSLKKEVTQLDKLVMDATYERKSQNEEFKDLMSSNNAAKELLKFAKNRLNKYYNPKQYAPTPKHEGMLQDSEPEVENSELGSPAAWYKVLETPPSLSTGRTQGTSTRLHSVSKSALLQEARRSGHRDDPGAPPPTFSSDYAKKSDGSTSVLSMLDLLIRDLTKEMTEAEKDEEHAQKDYESLMTDSAAKRAANLKSIHIAETSKADTEELKVKEEGNLKESMQELEATKIYEHQVHSDCDWLLQNFDLRKTARADEVDNLKRAKAILKGADFSFSQASRPQAPVALLSRGRV